MKKLFCVFLIVFMVQAVRGMDEESMEDEREDIMQNEKTYDNLSPYDTLAQETAQKWGLVKWMPNVEDKNERPLDVVKQLKIAKYYLYKEGNIEKIKYFHQVNALSYDDPYYAGIYNEGFSLEQGTYPLDWALCNNHVDFALWLLQIQDVDASYVSTCGHSKFHYVARGIVGQDLDLRYARLMKLLVAKKALINAIDNSAHTPLARYNVKSTKENFNMEVFQLFLNYGAQLIVGKNNPITGMRQCNIAETVVRGDTPYDLALLFKIRLDTVYLSPFAAVDYRNQLSYAKEEYDTCFKCLFFTNKRLKPFKIPKPIMHILCTMGTSDTEKIKDIKASLSAKIKTMKFPILKYAQVQDSLRNNEAFLKILDPQFWGGPLSECYNALDTLLNQKK